MVEHQSWQHIQDTKEIMDAIKKLKALQQQQQTPNRHGMIDLLTKVKTRISELDHCFDKAETKANVQNLILNILWTNLPDCYEDDSITTYRERIYEYFYMRYKDVA